VLTATTNRKQVDRRLVRLAARLGDVRTPMLRWGQATAKKARETARAKPGRRFWSDLARSVQVRAVGSETVSVHTDHVAAAQKQYGGAIVPRPGKKALTIPIAPEAKGKRAAEFEMGGRDLFVINRRDAGDTIGVLGYSDGPDSFHALFVLRRRVVQDADPWWPTQAETLAFGRAEFARFITERLRSA